MPLVPMGWLRDHVDIPADATPEELAAALVKVGLEEEEIHESDIVGPVVVGRVLTLVKEEQKNGKTINYCRVDVGQYNDAPGTGKEPSELPSRGIICGAHNFVEGDHVVVSLPGAVLPGGFEIAARKTYGHVSDGMICSARELGIGEDHNGIIVLDTWLDGEVPPVGTDALPLLGLGERVLEINVTPDRGYCFSMRGVAREYALSTGAAFRDPAAAIEVPAGEGEAFDIEIDDAAPIHGVPGCSRFAARVVTGVNPAAQSPSWMKDRLSAAGMRPISLAVDATNYVMLDLGQPLHAYDLAKVVGPIVVRRAREGEKLETLDGVTHTCVAEDLLIADCEGGHGARALGFAGVMGGADTEISETTTDILIEAAHFDPVSVARTARRHKIPSEASKRFERVVDPKLCAVAAQRVVDILVEYGGGTAAPGVTDCGGVPEVPAQEFKVSEVARLTGLQLETARVVEILEAIGCQVEHAGECCGGAVLSVTPPTWRPDLTGPAHFVEEIARIVGYDEIATILPSAPAGTGMTRAQRSRRDALRTLADRGWIEVLSYPFISESALDRQEIPADDPRRTLVRLVNPLQDEAPFMRSSLLDSLLATAAMNVSRGNTHVAVYEAGKVTHPAGLVPAANPGVGLRPSDEAIAALDAGTPAQPYHIAGVAVPAHEAARAGFAGVTWDWRDAISGAVDALEAAGVAVTRVAATREPWHPGRCAALMVGETAVGYAGELSPRVCKAWDLPARTVAFEIDLDAALAAYPAVPMRVKAVSVQPVAKEDIALVVDADVAVADVLDVIRSAGGDDLEDVSLFDVYSGDQLEEGKKSLAFALRFRAADRTLTAGDTAALRKKIVKKARHFLGAELRS